MLRPTIKPSGTNKKKIDHIKRHLNIPKDKRHRSCSILLLGSIFDLFWFVAPPNIYRMPFSVIDWLHFLQFSWLDSHFIIVFFISIRYYNSLCLLMSDAIVQYGKNVIIVLFTLSGIHSMNVPKMCNSANLLLSHPLSHSASCSNPPTMDILCHLPSVFICLNSIAFTMPIPEPNRK